MQVIKNVLKNILISFLTMLFWLVALFNIAKIIGMKITGQTYIDITKAWWGYIITFLKGCL